MTQFINREVAISSFYFAGGQSLKTFPRRMELDGRSITFAEAGLRYLISRGGRHTRLFDMNADDGSTYRLCQEGSRWTLVGTL